MRASLLQLVRDCGQRVCAVDQQLDGVAGARRRFARRPAAWRRVEGALPADSSEAPVVVIAHLLRDGGAEPTVDREREFAGSSHRLLSSWSCTRTRTLAFVCTTGDAWSERRGQAEGEDVARAARLFQPWKGERSPASHASRNPGVLRSQSGRISLVTARRSRRRSSTDGRPQNQ